MATAIKLRDPNTLSNYDKFRTRHITANFKIDFEKKRLEGEVALRLEVLQKANEIVLDTSYIDLTAITVDDSKAEWNLDARSEPYGSALRIQVDKDIEVGKQLTVNVSMAEDIQRIC